MVIRRAKMVCTLGPACDSTEVLAKLIGEAGMDVARFNFSHGTHAEHAARLTRLREASKRERSQMRRAARADKVTARMIYGTA